MNSINLTFGITYIALGLLSIIVSVPLVMRKIKMNRWYGIRLPKAFKSEENWYTINEYGGKQLILWSTVPLTAGIAILLMPPLLPQYVAILGIVPLLLFLPLIKILIFTKKL